MAGAVWAVTLWAETHFGSLNYPGVMRLLVLSLTAVAASVQIAAAGLPRFGAHDPQMTPERFLKATEPLRAGAGRDPADHAGRGRARLSRRSSPTPTTTTSRVAACRSPSARSLHLAAPEPVPGARPPGRGAAQAAAGLRYTSMGARSPFYGVFLLAMRTLGTLWLLAAVQALFVAWLMRLMWRTGGARIARLDLLRTDGGAGRLHHPAVHRRLCRAGHLLGHGRPGRHPAAGVPRPAGAMASRSASGCCCSTP